MEAEDEVENDVEVDTLKKERLEVEGVEGSAEVGVGKESFDDGIDVEASKNVAKVKETDLVDENAEDEKENDTEVDNLEEEGPNQDEEDYIAIPGLEEDNTKDKTEEDPDDDSTQVLRRISTTTPVPRLSDCSNHTRVMTSTPCVPTTLVLSRSRTRVGPCHLCLQTFPSDLLAQTLVGAQLQL